MYAPDLAHANFDHALELLALLPPAPIAVPISMLAIDLRVDGHGAVRELAKSLAAKLGIETTTWRMPYTGNVMALTKASWRDARRIAEAYLDSIGQP